MYQNILFILGYGNNDEYIHNLKKKLHCTYFFVKDNKIYDYVDDYMEKLKSEQCVVIGYSIGALIALKVSKQYSSKILKLILIGIPNHFPLICNHNGLKKTNIYSFPLKTRIMFDIRVFMSLYKFIIKYFPFTLFRRIYGFFNKDTPLVVLYEIYKNKINHEFVFNTILNINVFEFLRDNKNIPLHILIGSDDEYFTFSNIIHSYPSFNTILHKCQNIGHHIIYKNHSYLFDKLNCIINNVF